MRRRKIVGVIFSRADLQRALKMRNAPDLFELRLDSLVGIAPAIIPTIERLPAPVIITARHPTEGGANHLSSKRRRELLLEFLPYAAYVDVELRSTASLADVLRTARANHVRTILSFHDLHKTPTAARLDSLAVTARSLGADIVKFATRIDSTSQGDRLLDFFDRQQGSGKVVAMGIGKLGQVCRRELFRRGCLLNYAPLGRPQATGQLSIAQLRRIA
jgi:3-dehydroquinate dehydratase-1